MLISPAGRIYEQKSLVCTSLIVIFLVFLISCDGGSSDTAEPGVSEDPAGTAFNEDFEDELLLTNGSMLNFDNISTFTIQGTVDLISSGDFGITCAAGSACIDLDGSSPDVNDPASILTSESISISPGNYSLTFYMGGNQRSPNPICVASDSVAVSMEPFLSESIFTFDSSEELTLREMEFTANTSGQANLRIVHLGPSDLCGAILDDIEISRVN